MAVSVACNAADCIYHRSGMCDKMEITVSEGPAVQCQDYTPNRAQVPMGLGPAINPALLAKIFQGSGQAAPPMGPAGPAMPGGPGY